MALKKARVLRELSIDGHTIKPNSVLLLEEKQLAGYVADGSVDPNQTAVEYCEKDLGAKAVRPGKATEAEAPAA